MFALLVIRCAYRARESQRWQHCSHLLPSVHDQMKNLKSPHSKGKAKSGVSQQASVSQLTVAQLAAVQVCAFAVVG